MGLLTRDVAARVARARAAQAAWARLPLGERARRVGRLGGVIRAHRDEIVRTIVEETGTAGVEAEYQVLFSLAVVRYWGREGPRQLRPQAARVPLYLGPKRVENCSSDCGQT